VDGRESAVSGACDVCAGKLTGAREGRDAAAVFYECDKNHAKFESLYMHRPVRNKHLNRWYEQLRQWIQRHPSRNGHHHRASRFERPPRQNALVHSNR